MPSLKSLAEILTDLEAAHYFEGFTPAARKLAEQRLARQLSEPEALASHMLEAYPACAVMSVFGDAECVTDEKSYTRVLRAYDTGSFGLFKPKKVREDWSHVDDDATISFSFESAGKRYEAEIGVEGDYLAEEFFQVIEQAVLALEPPMKFFTPDMDWGQDFGCVFCTPRAYDRARAAGLLPEALENALPAHKEETPYVSPFQEMFDDIAAAKVPPDAESLWQDVTKARWLEGFSEESLAQFRRQVEQAYSAGKLHPATGLSVAHVQPARFLDASHAVALAHQLREKTGGLFSFDDFRVVEDAWGLDCVFIWRKQDWTNRPAQTRGKRPKPTDKRIDLWWDFWSILKYYCELWMPVAFHKFTAEDGDEYLIPHEKRCDSILWMPCDRLKPCVRREN